MDKKFVFIARQPVDSIFSSSSFCKFSIEIANGVLNYKSVAGRAPTADEFFSAVVETLFDGVEEGMENFPRFAERKNPYRITRRAGYSGCVDFFVEEFRSGDVVYHHSLHISMEGKANEDKSAYLDDILQVMLALNRISFGVDDNGVRHYATDCDSLDWFVRLEKFTARNIHEEKGWMNPDGTVMNPVNGDIAVPYVWERSGGNRCESVTEGWIGDFWQQCQKDRAEIAGAYVCEAVVDA